MHLAIRAHQPWVRMDRLTRSGEPRGVACCSDAREGLARIKRIHTELCTLGCMSSA